MGEGGEGSGSGHIVFNKSVSSILRTSRKDVYQNTAFDNAAALCHRYTVQLQQTCWWPKA